MCQAGEAYIYEDWTKEKDWYNRRLQTYCFKCDRPIKYNSKTGRWKHILNEPTNSKTE